MEAYRQRVIDEKKELDGKIERLNKFIASAGFVSLDDAEKLTREDFFFVARYLRLKGKLLVNPLEDEDEEEGGGND